MSPPSPHSIGDLYDFGELINGDESGPSAPDVDRCLRLMAGAGCRIVADAYRKGRLLTLGAPVISIRPRIHADVCIPNGICPEREWYFYALWECMDVVRLPTQGGNAA